MDQLRQERWEEKKSNPETQMNDIKMEEMKKELQQIPQLSNKKQCKDQLKESLRKSRSLSKSPDEYKSQTQQINIKEFCDIKDGKANESRAISPFSKDNERVDASLMMEKKCEEESEQVKVKVAETEAKLTLEQRMIDHIWQVRRNAYCELDRKSVV